MICQCPGGLARCTWPLSSLQPERPPTRTRRQKEGLFIIHFFFFFPFFLPQQLLTGLPQHRKDAVTRPHTERAAGVPDS